MTQRSKRCICGKSTIFPLCDGSHSSQEWDCQFKIPTQADRCFLSGYHYLNLAEKLSHLYASPVAHKQSGNIRCRELIVITDGSDIPTIQADLQRIQYEQLRVLCIGVATQIVSKTFPRAASYSIPDRPLPALWEESKRACSDDSKPTLSPVQPIFLSHAAKDEEQLIPAIEFLRNYMHFDFFVCADSIQIGGNWLTTIRSQLEQRPRFVYIASQNSNSSTFCAYEIGQAMALNKTITCIGLDNSGPPAFIQDIQAIEVPRLLHRKPWLSELDALIEALISAVTVEHSPDLYSRS